MKRQAVRFEVCFYAPNDSQIQARVQSDLYDKESDLALEVTDRLRRRDTSQVAVVNRWTAARRGDNEVRFSALEEQEPIRDIYAIDPYDVSRGVIFMWSYHDGRVDETSCVALRPAAGNPGSLYCLVLSHVDKVKRSSQAYDPKRHRRLPSP